MLKSIKTIFKQRKTYRFIFTNGASCVFKAHNIKITYNTETARLTKWEIIGAKGDVPFHVSPLDVMAIIELGK